MKFTFEPVSADDYDRRAEIYIDNASTAYGSLNWYIWRSPSFQMPPQIYITFDASFYVQARKAFKGERFLTLIDAAKVYVIANDPEGAHLADSKFLFATPSWRPI